MPNNSGVFSLSTYYNKDLSGDIPNRNRESYREYGYFLGIGGPLNRLDYSNDTTTTNRRVASINQYYSGGAGNSNFGYIMGGNKSGFNNITDIKRIDYSNDTNILSRGGLTIGRLFTGATGNSNFGYIAGGIISATPAYISTTERINYSNDNTTASIRGPLTISRGILATGNSNFGYFGGSGQASSGGSTVDRIDYSNDSATALSRGNIQNSNFSFSATGNNNFGYFLTGWGTSSSHRLNYANDTALLSIRGSLSFPKFWWPGSTGNSNFGYSVGGSTTGSQGQAVSTVDRIDYSNDLVVASVRGPLSNVDLTIAATSSHSFGGSPISQYGVFPKPFGYFGGGNLPGSASTIDRIDYSSDTSSASVRGRLTLARYGMGATGNSNFGYFGGGNPTTSIIDRINYTNDLATTLVRGVLSLSKSQHSAVGNLNFGYFCGGFPANLSSVDRISYSNDTSIGLPRGPLSQARYGLAATGTSNFGYNAGGWAPNAVSTIDRINYSNDNSSALNRNSLLNNAYSLAATGNSNFGYFSTGYVGPAETSIIYRLDYSNDTTAVSTRGPLSQGRRDLTATGNSNFGYFGGGIPQAGSPLYSIVDRIDYSNDTATASVRGPLSSARSYVAATSPTAFGGATDFQATSTFFDIQSMRRIEDTTNYSVKKRALGSYGYFAGGTDTGRTNVSRIDYSNDTANASNRGSLIVASSATFYNCVGNNNFSYMNTAVNNTNLQRIDYSNDTTNPTLFGGLSSLIGTYSRFTVYNDNFGYFGGGYRFPATLGGTTRIERLNYSNDTGSPVARGNTDSVSFGDYGLSNIPYGWIAAGNTSTIRRINFSNDNVIASNRGKLAVQVNSCGGSNNNNFGYWIGGNNPSLSPSNVTLIQRLDFSNDTTNASLRGNISLSPFSLGKTSVTGTGNQSFGYYSGGGFGEGLSNIERMTYSNDTVNTSTRCFLPYATNGAQASSNARNS